MTNSSMEKDHMKRLITYIYVVLATLFSFIFVFTCFFILPVSMVGILDIPYLPSKMAIITFLGAILFSLLARKNVFGKLILIINLLLMLFMIIYEY